MKSLEDTNIAHETWHTFQTVRIDKIAILISNKCFIRHIVWIAYGMRDNHFSWNFLYFEQRFISFVFSRKIEIAEIWRKIDAICTIITI